LEKEFDADSNFLEVHINHLRENSAPTSLITPSVVLAIDSIRNINQFFLRKIISP